MAFWKSKKNTDIYKSNSYLPDETLATCSLILIPAKDVNLGKIGPKYPSDFVELAGKQVTQLILLY